MKKIFLITLSLLFGGGVWAQYVPGKGGYSIQGKLTGDYQGKVYLVAEDGVGGNQTVVDSCEVVEGKYGFQGGKVEEVKMYYIKSKQGKVAPFFLEDGTIRIEGDVNDFYNAEVRGTVNNEILHLYNLLIRCVRDSTRAAATIENMQGGLKDGATAQARREQRYRENMQRCLAIEKRLVAQYADQPFAPLMLLFDVARQVSLEELKELRGHLDAGLSGHSYVVALDEYIRSQDFKPGSEGYCFCAPDVNGKELCLKNYRGKYVLLDFWASWCGPCRREMPKVAEIYRSYRGKNFEIIGVSLDHQPDAWKKAVEEMKMVWPQCSDLKGWNSKIAMKYNVHAIPATVLLDPEGKVEALNLRGEELERKIRDVVPQ